MALVVETGAGLLGAESYMSVLAFKAYADARGLSYAAASDTQIEQALRRGTAYLDGKYRVRWRGVRTNGRQQGVEWPRRYVNTYGGAEWTAANALIADDEVPREVIFACAEAAVRELASPGSLTPDVTVSSRVVQEQVGPISTTYAQGGGESAHRPAVTMIDEMLAPLLRPASFTATLMRA